jgi:hypothetical protein
VSARLCKVWAGGEVDAGPSAKPVAVTRGVPIYLRPT